MFFSNGVFEGCDSLSLVYGCMYENYDTYNISANINDGSCTTCIDDRMVSASAISCPRHLVVEGPSPSPAKLCSILSKWHCGMLTFVDFSITTKRLFLYVIICYSLAPHEDLFDDSPESSAGGSMGNRDTGA